MEATQCGIVPSMGLPKPESGTTEEVHDMGGICNGDDGGKCKGGYEYDLRSRIQEPRSSEAGVGERLMSFSERELDDTGRLLRERCREGGVCDAIRAYLQNPLDHWMDALRCGEGLDRTDMAAFAVGMNRTLAIRDALLISIILDEERCPREFLLDFASRPMLPRNARRLEKLLSESFHDAAAHPDMTRCSRGIGTLFDIIEAVPESYHVQPLAVIGYVLWWLGDDRAMLCAMRALAIDEGCSLAAIVCSAVHRHVGPAWIGETTGDTP